MFFLCFLLHCFFFFLKPSISVLVELFLPWVAVIIVQSFPGGNEMHNYSQINKQ